MGFIYTDRGEFVNAGLIVSIRRDSELYAFPAQDGSSGTESAWDLTVKMIDGTEHSITAHRAAEAKRLLDLPQASLDRDEAERAEAAALQLGDEDLSEADEELVEKALEAMVEERRASVAILQKRLGLTFEAATRILLILTMRGYLGPDEGGAREILVDLDAL